MVLCGLGMQQCTSAQCNNSEDNRFESGVYIVLQQKRKWNEKIELQFVIPGYKPPTYNFWEIKTSVVNTD